MLKKIYTSRFSYFQKLIILFIVSCLCVASQAQGVKTRNRRSAVDTTARVINDSARAVIVQSDTNKKTVRSVKIISPNAIHSVVTYSAKDSTVNDLERRYTYLFGDAVVKYEDMELYADYIEIDFKNNQLYASGVADSSGNVHGNPVFLSLIHISEPTRPY